MCVFYVFADIFRSHDMGGAAKTIWCLFVIFVPFLGVLVYLIARGGGMSERTMAQQEEMRRQQDEYVRSVVATSGGGSSADQIASAKRLLDAGTITQAEFDQMKAKALAWGCVGDVVATGTSRVDKGVELAIVTIGNSAQAADAPQEPARHQLWPLRLHHGSPRPDFDLLQVFLWPGEGRSQPGAMGRHVVSAIQ